MCMINLCNSIKNDLEFSNISERYFPYYDLSKFNLNLDSTLDSNLEYLELCNTYTNYGDYFKKNDIKKFSYDDFLKYKLNNVLLDLEDYVNKEKIKNNTLDSFISYKSEDDSFEDLKFESMMSLYDIKQYVPSKQSKLDNWFDIKINSSENTSTKDVYSSLTSNFEFNFIMACYNYAKRVLPKYRSKYSKKTYTQPQLFAILAYKIYHNNEYRENSESLELSDKLIKALELKKVPHFTTLQKFFKKIEAKHIKKIDEILLKLFPAEGCLFSLDGSGMTNNYSDDYYNKRTGKTKRKYIKNHITIDSKYMLIRHSKALNGARNDAIFAIAAINHINKYKPKYILADKAYDSENIRKQVNEKTTALTQIPVTKNPKTGKHRLNNEAIFRPTIYRFRNQVECVFSILKRKFSGTNTSRSTKLGKKETILKNLCYNIYRTIQLIQKHVKPHEIPI